jgi:hypothetical protein
MSDLGGKLAKPQSTSVGSEVYVGRKHNLITRGHLIRRAGVRTSFRNNRNSINRILVRQNVIRKILRGEGMHKRVCTSLDV